MTTARNESVKAKTLAEATRSGSIALQQQLNQKVEHISVVVGHMVDAINYQAPEPSPTQTKAGKDTNPVAPTPTAGTTDAVKPAGKDVADKPV